MRPHIHTALIRRMIAEDEQLVIFLQSKINSLRDGREGRPTLIGVAQVNPLEASLTCAKRGLEGLRLKLDAITDCVVGGRLPQEIAAWAEKVESAYDGE